VHAPAKSGQKIKAEVQPDPLFKFAAFILIFIATSAM
jgi:hypothetical protein